MCDPKSAEEAITWLIGVSTRDAEDDVANGWVGPFDGWSGTKQDEEEGESPFALVIEIGERTYHVKVWEVDEKAARGRAEVWLEDYDDHAVGTLYDTSVFPYQGDNLALYQVRK